MIAPFTFFVFVITFFLVPGFAVLKWTKVKTSFLCQIVLATCIGISFFILISLVQRFLLFPNSIVYLYPAIALFLERHTISSLLKSLKKVRISGFTFMFTVVTLTVAFFLSIGHITSGFVNGELHLTAARDSFWRLSIIQELVHHFPPQVPGFPPLLLKNYHFLYDFLIASTHIVTKIDVFSLYFRYFTLLSALLLVLLVYATIKLFVKSNLISLFGTLLTIFTGNLSYLLPLISSQYSFVARSNVFMSDQPFDQSHNPFNLLAYSFFLAAIILFFLWERKKNWKIFFALSVIVGILPGIKIYAGVLVFLGLGVALLYEIAMQRKIIFYTSLPLVFTVPILLLMKGEGFSILSFAPGWLLAKMVQDHDRLFLQDMVLKEQFYQQDGNMFRLTQIKLTQLFLYFVGNLNIRIIAFGLAIKKLRSTRMSVGLLLFIITTTLSSFLLPLFFSQTRGVYDSIQFAPYGLLLLSIVSVLIIDKISIKLKKFSAAGIVVLLVLIFIVAIPTNIVVLKERLLGKKEKTTQEEVDALLHIRSISSVDDIILSDLADEKLRLMYIPALSARRTLLSGATLAKQLGIETRDRENAIDDFFSYDVEIDRNEKVFSKKRKFLREYDVSYIYLSRSGLRFQTLLDDLGLLNIYDNGIATVYKVL